MATDAVPECGRSVMDGWMSEGSLAMVFREHHSFHETVVVPASDVGCFASDSDPARVSRIVPRFLAVRVVPALPSAVERFFSCDGEWILTERELLSSLGSRHGVPMEGVDEKGRKGWIRSGDPSDETERVSEYRRCPSAMASASAAWEARFGTSVSRCRRARIPHVRPKVLLLRTTLRGSASGTPTRGTREEAAEGREERLLEKYDYLLSLGNVDEFHLTDLKRRKSISARSMGALKRCVEWLTDLGLSEQEAVRVIFRFPPIVGLNYERKVEATYEWFQNKSVSKEKFLALVIRYPQFLGLSLEDNIVPALAWYMRTFDFTEEEAIKVLLKHPVILGYSIEKKVIPFLEYLMEEAALSKDELAVIIKVFPQIIGLNKKSVSKKLDFIRNEVGLEIDDLVKFPHLCGYSLDKRIRPRYMYLRHLGKEFALPPSKVLPPTDSDFAAKLGKSYEDYMAFCQSLR